jgi:hypothetical protein
MQFTSIHLPSNPRIDLNYVRGRHETEMVRCLL